MNYSPEIKILKIALTIMSLILQQLQLIHMSVTKQMYKQ